MQGEPSWHAEIILKNKTKQKTNEKEKKSIQFSFSFLFEFIYLFNLFIFSLPWVFVARPRFLQVWREGTTLCCGARASHCGGFSCCGAWALGTRASVVVARGLQQLWHSGSVVAARGLQSTGSVVVAHGLSCSTACGIFPDQGSNPCPLHWQLDS